MEDHEQQDNSPQRAGSEEALVSPRPPRGGSNSRAFKVAALTVLACLLLASQALTAYLVISQRSQIHSLQKNADKMSKRITARPQGPVQMHVPMNSMPLLKDFTEEDTKTQTPMTKLLPAEVMSVEKQVKVFLQNVSLPEFNQTFQRNLQSLQAQMDSEGWMSFETWMRNWLIFQMAQQTPSVPAKALQSKCFLQAKAVHPGFYKPQCDEQGHFKPMQCWHSTGFCWCVDAEGNPIPGSSMRGRPTCDGAPKPAPGMRRMLKTMQLESDK